MNKESILILERALFFFVFSCFIPLLAILSIDSYQIRYWGAILSYLALFFSTVLLIHNSSHEGSRMLTLTFWLYVYLFLGLAPMVQFYHGSMPLSGYYSDKHIIKTYLVIFLGLLFYQIGFVAGGNSLNNLHIKGKHYSKKFGNFNYIISKRKTYYLFLFSILSIICAISIVGNYHIIIYPRAIRNLILMDIFNGEGLSLFLILNTILCVPIFLSSFFFYIHLRSNVKSKKKVSIAFKLLFLFSIVINLIINNPISSARYFLGMMFLCFLFYSINWGKKTNYLRVSSILILIFIIVFPFADMLRQSYNAELPETISQKTIAKELAENGDFDSVQQLLNGIIFVEDQGNTYGKQIIGILLFWVPRHIWNKKPISSGTMIAEHIGYDFTNRSFPIWGEVFLDFGWFGIIVFFTTFGFVSRYLEKSHSVSTHNDIASVKVLAIILSSYQIFILRGALINAISYFIPIVFCLFFVSRKKQLDNARQQKN